jgi:alanine dehydrogenase
MVMVGAPRGASRLGSSRSERKADATPGHTGQYPVVVTDRPTLRYLSASDVAAAMPDLPQQLQLAAATLRALTGNADLPPKIGVHPRPDGSFAHAMPAWLRGPGPGTTGDLLGIKWVTGFPDNRLLDIPAIGATVLLSDAATGQPRAILDAAGITAVRTAAVSGVVIGHWAASDGTTPRAVALVGAGVQGESHLAMLGGVLPGSRVTIHDRDAARAGWLADRARASGRFDAVTTSASAAAAITGADVVITMVSFGPVRQSVPAEAFQAAALVVAVDYDMCVPARVVRDAALFLVDERAQFLANRAGEVFAGYPDPAAIIGARLDRPRPDGRVVVTHLGVGLADVVFGDAILRAAEQRGLGVLLPP